MKKTIKNFKIKNMSIDRVLNFILLLFIVLIVIFKNNETSELEKQINKMSLKEDTLFADIVNLSDYCTDSLFKSNIKWAYARYFYLFNEN